MIFLEQSGKLVFFNDKILNFTLCNKTIKKIEILFNAEYLDSYKEIENLEDNKIFMYFNSKWNVVKFNHIKIFENVHRMNGSCEIDIYYNEFRELGPEEMREFKIKSILDL